MEIVIAKKWKKETFPMSFKIENHCSYCNSTGYQTDKYHYKILNLIFIIYEALFNFISKYTKSKSKVFDFCEQ